MYPEFNPWVAGLFSFILFIVSVLCLLKTCSTMQKNEHPSIAAGYRIKIATILVFMLLSGLMMFTSVVLGFLSLSR